MTALFRRLLAVVFYAEHTTLPPGVDLADYRRLVGLGFTPDDAIWLCDLGRLCVTSLREYDGAVT